jgi:hypothetical protein
MPFLNFNSVPERTRRAIPANLRRTPPSAQARRGHGFAISAIWAAALLAGCGGGGGDDALNASRFGAGTQALTYQLALGSANDDALAGGDDSS